MGYNPAIRLNPKQLELVEDALRAEMGRIGREAKTQIGEFDQHEKIRAMKEINELLAHIHHQKSWYSPKEFVPLG
ncbi:MAG: hypothetical protein WBD37_10485 [Anderseniella sp.]